jgi:glucose-1-phosphate thymidylyltransferase
MSKVRDLIGLFPAAGQATRLSPLPCSKELYPLGLEPHSAGQAHPKVVGQYLLEAYRTAGIEKVFVVLRDGKWDIPAYFGDGAALGLNLAYLLMNLPYGVPYTLDQATPFLGDANVALGFPDILFQPADAFLHLWERQLTTGADVVLGLFPADEPHKCDMVDLDSAGRLRDIVIKPVSTSLRYSWILAVWTPVFTRFMHAHLQERRHQQGTELFVGDVFRGALRAGVQVETVLFPQGAFVDVGTPDALRRTVHALTAEPGESG